MGKIHVRLLEILAANRMKMTDLSRQTKVGYKNINNLANEKTKRVDLNTVAKICEALDCQPGDIFVYKA